MTTIERIADHVFDGETWHPDYEPFKRQLVCALRHLAEKPPLSAIRNVASETSVTIDTASRILHNALTAILEEK